MVFMLKNITLYLFISPRRFSASLLKYRHYTNYLESQAFRVLDPAVSTPNWIAFRVTKNEGVGASHDFTGKNPFAFALLDS
jgi:hypothetical protein